MRVSMNVRKLSPDNVNRGTSTLSFVVNITRNKLDKLSQQEVITVRDDVSSWQQVGTGRTLRSKVGEGRVEV